MIKRYDVYLPIKALPTQHNRHQKIFVTADEHYCHYKINEYQGRPFPHDKAGTLEGNATMVANHNSVVGEGDHVIHAGDICLGRAADLIEILRQLNGHHYLMGGSHDWALGELIHATGIPEDLQGRITLLPQCFELRYKGEDITLHHYAQAKWWKSHYGSVHLFGHSHNNFPGIGRSIDIGVDCHNFFPLYIETAIEMAKSKQTETNYPRRQKVVV